MQIVKETDLNATLITKWVINIEQMTEHAASSYNVSNAN